jgi:hypothetical protein
MKLGEAMSNLGVFSWIRDSVRRSVLLGVSDAVEQMGMATDASEPINPQLAAVLREAATPAIGHTHDATTLDSRKKTRPKRLGRSLDQFRNPPQQGAGGE